DGGLSTAAADPPPSAADASSPATADAAAPAMPGPGMPNMPGPGGPGIMPPPAAPGPAMPPGAANCPAPSLLGGGQCTAVDRDLSHCGECNHACAIPRDAQAQCVLGICVTLCAPGLTLCGERCIDTASNQRNCGACDRRCKGNQRCETGRCVMKK